MLRAVFAAALLVQAEFYLRDATATGSAIVVGLAALSAGVLLLVGFLTPLVGAIVGTGMVGIGLSMLPSCMPNLFDSRSAIVFAGTMLVGIIILGPGAFSLDARVFGRREIIIPRR